VRKVTFAFLWVFVFFIPLENLLVFEALGTLTRVLGLVAFAVGLLAVAASGRVRVPSPVILISTVFFLWAFLGYQWAPSHYLAGVSVRTNIQLLGMIWLIWEFAPSAQPQRRLMAAYLCGSLATALQTIWSYLVGAGRYSMNAERFVGEGFDPNSVGVLIGLSIPMAFYLVTVYKRGYAAWAAGISCVIACAAIPLTGSRGASVAALAGILLLPWSKWATSPRRKLSLAATVLAAVAIISFAVPRTTWQRIGTIGESIASGDVGGRGAIWRAGLIVFTEHPIVGSGTAGFRRLVVPHLGAERVAHNAFLSVLVDHGLIGLALYLALYACLLATILRLPALERRISLAVLACWLVGAMSLSLQGAKASWFVVAIVASQAVLARGRQTKRTKTILCRFPAHSLAVPGASRPSRTVASG